MRELTASQLELELKKIFRERKRKQPSFTYRALASELGLHHTTLFRVLQGDRHLGKHSARDLASRLGVTFVSSKVTLQKKKPDFFELKRLDSFSETQIHWLSLAILESLKLPDFEPQISWIAKRFALSGEAAAAVIARMEREGLLRKEADRWIDVLGDAENDAPEVLTTQIVRTMLKDIMSVSAQAVDHVPFEKREHSFAVFPVATRQLPALKSKLNRLRQEFGAQVQKSKFRKNEIYAFHLGFFPLTKETI